MKKSFIKLIPVFTLVLSVFFINSPTHASCPPTFYVGSEIVYGCPGVTNNPEIPGFSIDLDNDKITLNNYHGGGIYFSCQASCSPTKHMEIELIGKNIIDPELSTSVPQTIWPSEEISVGFINIFPTFTGTGSLNIEATIPFTFTDDRAYNLKITSEEYNDQASSVIFSTPENTSDVDAIVDDEELEVKPEEEIITTIGAELANTSFFDTLAGIILLIAVPSVLLIIILALTILLIRTKKKVASSNNINPIDTTNINQQF